MKTLRFYLIKEQIAPIVVSALFFVFILLILRLFAMADLLLSAGVGGGTFLKLMAIIAGTLLSLAIPMAVLLGTLIAVGRLTAENEILAIRAAGVSIARAFYPVVIVSFLLSLGLAWFNNAMIPRLFNTIDSIRYEVEHDLVANLKPNTFYTDLGAEGTDITLYFSQRDDSVVPKGDTTSVGMRGLNMRFKTDNKELFKDDPEKKAAGKSDSSRQDFLVFADTAILQTNVNDVSKKLVMYNGAWMPIESAEKPDVTLIRFEKLEQPIKGEDRELAEVLEKKSREMQYGEIMEALDNPPEVPVIRDNKIQRVWRDYFSMRNEFISRFTMPLSCVAFVLIAIPLAMTIKPTTKSFSFLIAFALMGAYYTLHLGAQSIGSTGVPTAIAAAALMVPNVVVGGVGLWLFRRAMWR